MTSLGYTTLDVIPSLKGAAGTISKELSGATKTAGTQAGRQLGTSMSTAASHEVSSRMGGLLALGFKKVLPAVGIGAILTKGFSRLNAIDQAKAKLEGLGNSASTVQTIMDNALASVKGTAFGLDQAATTAGAVVAAGIKPGKELEGVLKTVADTATIAGASMSDMGQIFGSVAARGKLQGDDLMQLQSRGIPVLATLAKHYGITAQAASEMVSKGQVDFKTFADAMHEKLGGAALASGDTVQGAMDNVSAAVGRVGASLLSGVFPQLRDGLGGLTASLDALQGPATAVGQGLGATLKVVSAIPGPLKLAAGGWLAYAAAQRIGLASTVSTRIVAMRGGVLGLSASMRMLAADASLASRSLLVAGANSTRATAAISRTRRALGTVAKGGALLGAVAVASTGAADGVGLTNTATLGLAGTLLGPMGAATGAAIGGFLDMKAAGDKLDETLNRTATTVPQLEAKLASLKKTAEGFDSNASGGGFFSSGYWSDWGHSISSAFSGDWASKLSFGLFGKSGADKAKDGIAATAKEAAKAQDKLDHLTGSARIAAAAEGKLGDAAKTSAKKQLAANKIGNETVSKFRDIAGAAKAAKGSLEAFGKHLRDQAKAMREFGDNAYTAAQRGVKKGLIKQLAALGPEGAEILSKLAHGSKQNVDAMNADFRRWWKSGKDASGKVAAALGGVTRRNWNVNLGIKGTGKAIDDVVTLRRQIGNLHDKTVTIRVRQHRIPLAGTSLLVPGAPVQDDPPHRAAGGPVTSGRTYLVGENGPELFTPRVSGAIIPNRSGLGGPMVPPIGEATKALHAFTGVIGAAVMIQRTSTKALQSLVKHVTSEVDKTKDSLQGLRQAASSLMDSVKSQFDTSSAFGVTPDAFSGWVDHDGNSLFNMLSPQRQAELVANAGRNRAQNLAGQATSFAADIGTLKSEGWTGQALLGLSSSGNVQLADYLASLSKADSLAWMTAYNQSAKAVNQAAKAIKNDVYGERISHKLDKLHDLEREMKSLKHEIKQLHSAKTHQDLADRNGEAVADALDKSATKGKQKAGAKAPRR